MDKKIFVYIDLKELKNPVFLGVLNVLSINGRENISFEYTKNWLNESLYRYYKYIDPELDLFEGVHYLPERRANFGSFMDASPDSWGAKIMERREAIIAKEEGRRERELFQTDYMLGVDDATRSGALRFKLTEAGSFLSDNKGLVTPPFTSLEQLEKASMKIEENDTDDPEYSKWINMLISPSSALGGARPKASVLDTNDNLWIAKFPSLSDKTDVGAWEMVTNELAKLSGLTVAEGMVKKFNNKYHTYLSKRFDRKNKKERIHFASAKTLTGAYRNDKINSYLHIAKVIIQHGANTNKDLEELWRRIVFSICVKNTDDHMRNHGFLLTKEGWSLSPAYDINPNRNGMGLYLNISETSNALDLNLALDVADQFRLSKIKGKEIVETVKKSLSRWREFANSYSIPQAEQDQMAHTFLT